MTIAEIRQTCCGCPSQWEGRLADGRAFYVRYRWGYLSIRTSEGSVDDAVRSEEEAYGEQIGKPLDGMITLATVLEKTPLRFATGTELWDDES